MCDYNNMTDYCGWSNVFGNDKNWTWAQGPDLAHGITSLENGHNYDGSARVSGETIAGFTYASPLNQYLCAKSSLVCESTSRITVKIASLHRNQNEVRTL